ncbi:uncharacterized protein [Pempheris klunzingeri]|uniref:uncharacterized protein n=1 Tax=Pempheris klunzingeri TaxID=3127111 RepID=UPI00397FABC0
MGNRFSRRRDAPAHSAETAATEQKAAAEPAATQPALDSGITQTQEAVDTQNLDAVVGEPATPAACSPTEECESECKAAKAPAAPAPLNDPEPEPVAKETPPEPLVSVSQPSPSEPESVAEPNPVAEAQIAPEPAPEPSEPKPVAEAQPVPEPVPESEPTSNPEAEAEAVPEPISESAPAPAEALEQPTDMLTQESLPEPELPSPPLIDLDVADVTPQPVNTPPSPASIPAPGSAVEPSDITLTEECQDTAEVSVTSTFELEKSEVTSEPLEKPMEMEAAENLEQLVSDVNEESVSGLLKNLELTGNDLVADLTPTDVKIPDDTLITDMSTSTELM